LEIARQELIEETGIEAGSSTPLGRVHTSNCFLDEVCHLFLAEDLAEGPANPDPQEILQTRRVPFIEAVRMAERGEITDGISLAGIFRLMLHLNSSKSSRDR